MKKLSSTAITVAAVITFCMASSFAQVTRYVVTDDDNPSGNTATFFKIGAGGALTQTAVVPTGGVGLGGGYFASSRVTMLRSQGCIYISNNGDNPGTVSGIVESTQTLAGAFAGSAGDNGDGLGISMA